MQNKDIARHWTIVKKTKNGRLKGGHFWLSTIFTTFISTPGTRISVVAHRVKIWQFKYQYAIIK